MRYVRKVWRYQRIIRSHKPKKDRQYNGQVKQDKRTKIDQQIIITQKTKDWPTGSPLKTEGKLRCSGRVSSSCSTFDTRRVIVKRHEHHLIWKSCWTPIIWAWPPVHSIFWECNCLQNALLLCPLNRHSRSTCYTLKHPGDPKCSW